MLIGLHALELAPKKAAGTAAGFTGLFGYLGGSVAASAIGGYTADFRLGRWLYGDDRRKKNAGGTLLVAVMIGEKRHHAEVLARRQ